MNPVVSENGVWIPKTVEDKEKVRQQMNRLLETSHFKNSRRYPLLFRFIIEETLEGRGEFLKERLIGVRVFDRPADYDTAEDPVVRVTIAEIRKRIAQYYYEEAHDSEMRIELLPGRYVPEFRPSKDDNSFHQQALAAEQVSADLQTTEHEVAPPISQPVTVISSPSDRRRRFSDRRHRLMRPAIYTVGAIVAILVVLGTGLSGIWRPPSALDEFWGPTLANQKSVILCLPVGARAGAVTAAEAGILVQDHAANQINTPDAPPSTNPLSTSFLDYEVLGENLVFSDALAAVRISDYLATRNRQSNLRSNRTTTLDDLMQGPVVLVGGLDNQWTLRALSSLRFRFAGTTQEEYWITDTKNPAMKDWGLDLKVHLSDVKRDYAIIARIHDDSTGQIDVIAAGIGMSATAAAGEFLVDPKQMNELRRQVGSGFRNRDFEAVLSTDVVNGIAGSPRILAVAVR